MNQNDIDKSYVSPIDKFLYGYDATHEKTASQLKEIKKSQLIANKRDNQDYQETKTEIWESF